MDLFGVCGMVEIPAKVNINPSISLSLSLQ